MASSLDLLLFFLCGMAAGGAGVWLAMRARLKGEAALADRFKALAADTLNANNQAFLDLAETRLRQSEQQAAATLDKKATGFEDMVKPVRESLQKLDTQIQALEVKREGAYRELAEMVRLSNEAQQLLRGETSQLLQALRTPTTRGRWGEIQLRRILEMTGMSAHVRDFAVQQTISANDGALRPDVIVNLPGERCIVVDSKVPLADYMNATQANDDTARQAFLRQHARQVREHVKDLSSKAYWSQVEGTPEFVVLFLPGDHFLAAALDQDQDLMDFAVTQKIILATPMTLVALLRTVAYGWRQEALRDNARRVGVLGGELHAALVTLTDHIGGLGNKLGGALDSYNKLIGSYERNVLNKARKLKEYGAAKDGKELPEGLDGIDAQPRSLNIADIDGQDSAA